MNPDLPLYYQKVKDENETVKQIRKTVKCASEMQYVYLRILWILGMVICGFHSNQTPYFSPKMPLICCCRAKNDEA